MVHKSASVKNTKKLKLRLKSVEKYVLLQTGFVYLGALVSRIPKKGVYNKWVVILEDMEVIFNMIEREHVN